MCGAPIAVASWASLSACTFDLGALRTDVVAIADTARIIAEIKTVWRMIILSFNSG
jgi:hypothetical protein